MPGRKPILENELPLVLSVLSDFPLRDQALVTLGLQTGFRISELLSLNVGDVWDGAGVRPQVKVTRARMKGGSGARRRGVTSRIVPLNDAAVDCLHRFLMDRAGEGELPMNLPLFPSRFRGKRLTDIVHAVLRSSGLDDDGVYGTHTLRKTFCRRIYSITQHDLNLTRAVMGHASCSTTQRYLHVDDDEIAEAVRAIGGMRKPASLDPAKVLS
ncbi:tyrosine-type recombinase/integrase [Actomonas aquatica]|uniref:Tyrosine-type recombinase/integrase n=1 Tax=Actomonas aquatica TaxID=2866162 RepID=A0ABZ1C243_9BACT|nr:tyrosine-type recombinase/integrase [Opitutus sp. WL0086]WRQ85738.1 tyrosine-type recombinase/integrase [Opitutus sp. WL0086]